MKIAVNNQRSGLMRFLNTFLLIKANFVFDNKKLKSRSHIESLKSDKIILGECNVATLNGGP